MKKLGNDVEVEPHLQLLDIATSINSTCTKDEARLDICTKGWGSRFERFFYDVKIFIPYAPTNRIKDTNDAYLLPENLKRLKYHDRFVDIDNCSFLPLILSPQVESTPSNTNSSDALLPS